VAQKQEAGNWKPYQVPTLERSIAAVFRTGDIGKLDKYTYKFIVNNMGFIAHYDLHGFRCAYADLDEFRTTLQTSEYSRGLDYNLNWADSYEGDRDFLKWYGPAYCQSVAAGIRRIVAVARTQREQYAML